MSNTEQGGLYAPFGWWRNNNKYCLGKYINFITEKKLENKIFKNKNGDYQDKAGNFYYEEKILRYRVMTKYVGSNARENERWRLTFSSSSLEQANKLVEHQTERMKKANYKNLAFKVVDNGKASSHFSLMY